MALLREYFALVHPPLLRRQVEVFKLVQKPGESFTAFEVRFDEAWKDAEMDNITTERLKVIQLIAGTTDTELIDRFLELDEPTCEDLYNTACKYEAWQRCFPKRKSRTSRRSRRERQ